MNFMHSIPTYRRGRRKVTPGPKRRFDQRSCFGRSGGVCGLIGTFLLVLIPLLLYIHMERERFYTYTSLMEVANSTILELPIDAKAIRKRTRTGEIVHGSSEHIKSTVSDPVLGIQIDNALTLNRNTEYCQWREIRSESCNTCSRNVKNDDGTIETEKYECDCTTQYDYVKGWTPYLINSFLFDQPAAHYNPHRDPVPSSLFVAHDASMTFEKSSHGNHNNNIVKTEAYLSPGLLKSRVRGARTRNVNWVPNAIPRAPPFWFRWIPDRSRYENLSSLEHLMRFVPSQSERFTYVGNGYFFSAYESSKMEQLMKMFGEYVEGSLFDWQIGDLFPTCKPGDIRLKYSVQDPESASVLGEVASTSNTGSVPSISIQSVTTSSGFKIGYVHNGVVSAPEMIERENSDSRWMAVMCRILCAGWAFFTSRRLFYIAGYDLSKTSIFKQMSIAFSLWGFLTGCILTRLWGSSFDSNLVTTISIVAIVALLNQNQPALPQVRTKHVVKEHPFAGESETESPREMNDY